MAREALLEMDCNRYSKKITDVIKLLDKLGWKYYDFEKNVTYLPLEDSDYFNWQKRFLSEDELQRLINKKQDNFEKIGIVLYHENSKEGLTLLANNTDRIVMSLNINRKTIENNRESVTDVGWYFENVVQKLEKVGCHIDYVKFEEYTD